MGTNNFPDCSNMCHEASGTGLKRSIGVGKARVTAGEKGLFDETFINATTHGVEAYFDVVDRTDWMQIVQPSA
nr:oxidoreductase major subunit [Candidatus Pantoea persica]